MVMMAKYNMACALKYTYNNYAYANGNYKNKLIEFQKSFVKSNIL